MKMIIVIVKDSDADALTQKLTGGEYRVTRVASTGGFLRSGVVTLLIGVDEARVDSAIALVRESVAGPSSKPATGAGTEEKRATLFVVPVQRFEQI